MAVEAEKHRRRVGRAAAEPGAGRNVLLHPDRGGGRAPGALEERRRGAKGEIARVRRRMRREGAVDGKLQRLGRGDLDAVADVGEDGDAVEQMIAVGAAAGHVQREIDLRRRASAHAGADIPLPCQMSPGMRSCMPGKIWSGLFSLSLLASMIFWTASPDLRSAAEIVHSESPGFTV